MTTSSQPGCLFCGIVAGDVPAEVVQQDAGTMAIRDISPAAPTHVLVIPRNHHDDLAAMAEADAGLTAAVMSATTRVAALEGLTEGGYRVVINTGADAGQTVGHVHAHVLGGRSMTWPPG